MTLSHLAWRCRTYRGMGLPIFPSCSPQMPCTIMKCSLSACYVLGTQMGPCGLVLQEFVVKLPSNIPGSVLESFPYLHVSACQLLAAAGSHPIPTSVHQTQALPILGTLNDRVRVITLNYYLASYIFYFAYCDPSSLPECNL